MALRSAKELFGRIVRVQREEKSLLMGRWGKRS
jgi:hypothetical protein